MKRTDRLKMLKVDVDNARTETVELQGELSEYYKLIGCSSIEISQANILGKTYDIIMDEEAALKQGQLVSVVNRMGEMLLLGNVLICHYKDGKETSLSDKEIEEIRAKRIRWGTSTKSNKRYQVLMID